MDPKAIIDAIADSADEFLAAASNRVQARAGIEEQITADYPGVPPTERARIVSGVMAVLEREGFFEGMPTGSLDDDEDDDNGE